MIIKPVSRKVIHEFYIKPKFNRAITINDLLYPVDGEKRLEVFKGTRPVVAYEGSVNVLFDESHLFHQPQEIELACRRQADIYIRTMLKRPVSQSIHFSYEIELVRTIVNRTATHKEYPDPEPADLYDNTYHEDFNYLNDNKNFVIDWGVVYSSKFQDPTFKFKPN